MYESYLYRLVKDRQGRGNSLTRKSPWRLHADTPRRRHADTFLPPPIRFRPRPTFRLDGASQTRRLGGCGSATVARVHLRRSRCRSADRRRPEMSAPGWHTQ
jgi:hypothetical protein